MPRNKYPEETKQKILDAATKLFMEKGFEQTTVLDIIGETGGLTRGAFYHHFKSKDDVLEAVLIRHWESTDPFVDTMNRVMNAKHENGLEKLKAIFRLSLNRNISSERNAAMTNIALQMLSSPRFFYEHHKSNLETAKWIQPIIAEGMADGSIKPGNAKALSELIVIMVNYWFLPQIFPGDVSDLWERGEIADRIFEMLGMPFLDEEMGEVFASSIGLMMQEDHCKN